MDRKKVIKMSLQKQIMEDLKQAMRDKDTLKKGVLTLVKAGLMNAEKEKRSPLTSVEELAIVQREIKQTKQALSEAEKANREDIVEQEKLKIAILEQYLPAQLSKDEVKEKLYKSGINSKMNMGEAMKQAMSVLKGRADNKVISEVVREILNS